VAQCPLWPCFDIVLHNHYGCFIATMTGTFKKTLSPSFFLTYSTYNCTKRANYSPAATQITMNHNDYTSHSKMKLKNKLERYEIFLNTQYVQLYQRIDPDCPPNPQYEGFEIILYTDVSALDNSPLTHHTILACCTFVFF